MRNWGRLVRDVLLRVLLILLTVSCCSFATLRLSILRQLYQAAIDFGEFLLHVGDHWGPIAGRVLEAYARSMILLVSAMATGLALGVLLGIIAAMRANYPSGKVVSLLSYVGLMTPSFLFGLAVMVFFVRYMHRFTNIQFILLFPKKELTLDPRYILAPALTLAARPVAHIAHITATHLQEELAQDYVRTARSKGLPGLRVLWRHLWPNVRVPIIRAVADTFLFSLSSLPIVEFIFSWPGIGLQVLEKVFARDAALVSFLLVTVGVTYVLINLVVETMSRWLDPRLRSFEKW